MEGDCHLPVFCRSVSSVPAWTLRPTCPSEIPKTRACGSWLSVGGPAPLSALGQPLKRLACGLAPGAPGDHIAAGWFPGNAYLWQAAFPGKTRAR